MLSTQSFIDPISRLDYLVKHTTEGFIRLPWPPEMTRIIGQNFYENLYCISAWKVVSIHVIASIIDTVRTRILEFTIAIEKEAPDAEDTPLGKSQLTKEKISLIVSNIFMGDVQNLAIGSHDITQLAQSIHEIYQGDWKSLEKFLAGLGVESSELEVLGEALEEDSPEPNGKSIGVCTKEWIKLAAGKVASGTGAISIALATELISKAISAYFGISL